MDLLLMEEIHASKKFRDLIYSKIESLKEFSFIGAWHSYHEANLGESDIILIFEKKNNETVMILIENKIDAKFTKNQAERYNQRADQYMERKECHEAHVLLIAPEEYLKNTTSFINTLSYEEIKQYFVNEKSENQERFIYKSKFLEYAIEKKRRGYSPIYDKHVTEFQHKYYNLSKELFPNLKMRKPKATVPSGSGFLYFSPKGINEKISLVHKFIANGDFNFLDIQFNQQIDYMDKFKLDFENKLNSNLSIESANKSFVVRKRIDKIDIHKSFEEQKEPLIESLVELDNLYSWLKDNYKHLMV